MSKWTSASWNRLTWNDLSLDVRQLLVANTWNEIKYIYAILEKQYICWSSLYDAQTFAIMFNHCCCVILSICTNSDSVKFWCKKLITTHMTQSNVAKTHHSIFISLVSEIITHLKMSGICYYYLRSYRTNSNHVFPNAHNLIFTTSSSYFILLLSRFKLNCLSQHNKYVPFPLSVDDLSPSLKCCLWPSLSFPTPLSPSHHT